MQCPVCGEELEHIDTDHRQEWERIEYWCGTCQETYTRRITYKTQSSMVQSDEWEDLPETKNKKGEKGKRQ